VAIWGVLLRRVVFNIAALVALLLLSPEVWAEDLFSPVPINAQKAERFDGWYAGGFWASPGATFKADHGIYIQASNPISSVTLSGSLGGVTVGRGFRQGMFYYGFVGSFAAGVVDGQTGGSNCAGDCYTSLNALGEATFSVGVVFWQQLLVYFGLGPNLAFMRSGQTLYGLNDQFVWGEHGTLGIKYALNDHWAFSSQIERLRVGDLSYITPSSNVGVNTHDFWLGTLGFEYWF
jgi:hypothetical protein